MASLLSIGQMHKQQAGNLMQGLAQQEQQRNQANETIQQQEKSQMIGGIGTGLGVAAAGGFTPPALLAGGIIALGSALF